MNPIYIYGASGHGLVVADIARACCYDEIIFIDDGDNPHQSFSDIKSKNSIPLAFGIGSNSVRKKLFEIVESHGFDIITLVHPSATISNSVILGRGSVVMAQVVINAYSKIGEGAILNTSSVIEHENIIGTFVHISPNVALAGDVKVDQNTHIGIGSSVIQGITIGKNCIIGAGSVVVKNISNNTLAYGNPCKVIRKTDE